MGFVIQSGFIYLPVFFMLAPSFVVQFARMMIMNLCDYESDLIVNKRTLVVGLGPKRTILIYGFSHIFSYSFLIIIYLLGYISLEIVLTTLCTLPISIWQYKRIKKGGYKGKIANSIVFWASTHSVLMILAVYLGIILEMWFSNYFRIGRNPNLFVFCAILPFIYLIVMLKQIIIPSTHR
ncbi:MAG: hypothetical protein GKR88_19865 [Flavobacteriaceae bacterium]|nr:MAG: hypothetical protein GKR88_19865 [Flavobacteriaceae bacterium]